MVFFSRLPGTLCSLQVRPEADRVIGGDERRAAFSVTACSEQVAMAPRSTAALGATVSVHS